jgi:pantetheine-phosphate adenylyltransferase
MTHALIPGSFDPVTNGHLDIIGRAAGIYDTVLVSVVRNYSKAPLFTIEERMEMLADACSAWSNIRIGSFEGLLVEYATQQDVHVIVKGLRAVSDFEYEFQMAQLNRHLNGNVETVFMMTGTEYAYLSSSIVKEIARLGGTVKGLVPENVEARLRQKLERTEQ